MHANIVLINSLHVFRYSDFKLRVHADEVVDTGLTMVAVEIFSPINNTIMFSDKSRICCCCYYYYTIIFMIRFYKLNKQTGPKSTQDFQMILRAHKIFNKFFSVLIPRFESKRPSIFLN